MYARSAAMPQFLLPELGSSDAFDACSGRPGDPAGAIALGSS
jgi:hypothetical protein